MRTCICIIHMSTYSTVSNYGGRQPNNTSYIKQFVQSFDDVMAWIYVTVGAGTTYIEPSVTDKTILIPQSMIVVGDLTVDGVFSNPSDVALKEDVKYLGEDAAVPSSDDGLEPFDKLQPCVYRYKTDTERTHYGLIAQEVEPLYPTLVGLRDDGMKTVNYLELVPILIAEVQALKGRVRELAAELDAYAEETDKEILDLDDQIMNIKRGYF